MILIVGLGNIGRAYEETRHNIGFQTVDVMAKQIFENPTWNEKFSGEIIKDHYGKTQILFLKPSTLMNNSGVAVAEAAKFYKIPQENIWVIYDDLDIPVGTTRIRTGGSAGGHNGIKSIDEKLGKKDYKKIRIGIGKANIETSSYVLAKFRPEEQNDINEIINLTASHLEQAIKDGELKDETFSI